MISAMYKKRPSIGLFVALSILVLCCESGKILVYPLDGSHWINMKVLIEELHFRGHNLTVIRPNSSWYITENPSLYTTITVPDPPFWGDFFEEYLDKMMEFQRSEASFWSFLKAQIDLFSVMSNVHIYSCNAVRIIIEDKELVKRLHDERYDLALTDPGLAGGVILAHYLKLPLVLNVRGITATDGHFVVAPSPLSYIPVPGNGLSDKMTFMQRVMNVLLYMSPLFQDQFVVGPHYKALCDKYLDNDDCNINSLIQAADIWLMRVDFVFEFPRPTMPNLVYIGGFQCKPSKPLPEDLEAFVESSGDHGFVIMSLGTIINSLPADTTDEIAAVFAKLPQKVIWRHLGPRPYSLGNNTLLVKWMPQNDLLGHLKIKAFIAHGGTNGLQEAIYHGVPVLGIPLLFDQFDNLVRIQERGAGKIIQLSQLNGRTFEQRLQEVINNKSYGINMKRLSDLHRDQPMKPLDRAVFWIEYVMRHKGATHLRTESYKMPWYSYHSIDVILFLLSIATFFIFTIVALIKFICCRPCRSKLKSD